MVRPMEWPRLAVFVLFAALLWSACDGTPLDDNDRDGESEFAVYFTDDGLADNTVTDIAVDYARSGVWFATLNGISFYSYTDSVMVTFGAESNLPDMETTSIAVDYLTATVWAGTVSGAASFADTLWHTLADRDSLPSRYVTALAATGNGSVIFGTKGGAARLNMLSGWDVWTFADGLIGTEITSLAIGLTGDVWVGSTLGVSVLDDGGWRTYDAADLPNASVNALFSATNGYMWVGTINGMTVREGTSWRRYGTFDGLPSPVINDFTEDAERTIWAATDGGVASLYNGAWTELALPSEVGSERVLSVAADIKRGVLWIGTDEGLVRYTPHTGETARITPPGRWWVMPRQLP